MEALQAREQGPPEVLSVDEVSRPEPSPEEVLIEVRATGVNVIDCMIRREIVPDSMKAEFPWVPGWDVSGVVKSVGRDVDQFESGDPVYGMHQKPESGETYAEFTTVPEDHLAEKPEGMSHERAASIPMAALTASYALFNSGNLQSGETVLIHAAAGGVGHLAVQLADRVDARVIGTASARNESFLDGLGVDQFVNYRNTSFDEECESVDLVIDAIGGEVLEKSIRTTKPGGRVITLPQPPSHRHEKLAEEQSVECSFFSITSTVTREQWQGLNDLVGEGVLTPTISNEYSLSEANEAHRECEDGHVRGKLVLTL